MATAGQYQGSQAFNHITPLSKESVNPNTGSLNFSLPLVKLQGKRSSIDLTVNLFYSAGFAGTFGLPRNWGLDFPYILHGKSVTANGRTYAIDPEWTDVKGHASGLRYTNNHGIKFEPVVPPKSLPSKLPGEYAYKLSHVDGSVDYFDTLGKPVEHHDIYGNFLHYSYITGDQEGPDSANLRIHRILDSWGQEIKFAYEQGAEMSITLPDKSETRVQFTEDGVYLITDAIEKKIEIEYAPFDNSVNLLSSITYPSGLISRYEYIPIEYLNQDGKIGYMPAVQYLRCLDAAKNVYQHTQYIYGRESAQTYTGAAIGCRMGGSVDSLMDNDDRALDYMYDVTTLSLDGDEKPIAQTLTWFNNLHLPTKETRFLRNDQGEFVEASKAELTYKIDKEKRARITSYNLPVGTETFSNTSSHGNPTWQAMTRTEAEYNEYGNPVETTQWLHVEGSGYAKQSSVKTEYATTEKKVQLPTKTWNTDEISCTVEYKEHKPTQDGRSIASAVTWFQDRLEPGAQPQPWKETAFEYDASGRLVSTTTAWSAGAKIPDGSLRSVTTKTEYADLRDGILSRTEIDALGNRTVIQKDVRQVNGPDIRKTLSLGQTENWQYDGIGRIIKHTNALGQQTTTAYGEDPTGTCKTVTSPQKYCTKTSFDVLGRETQVLDNGDPTLPFTDQPTRALSQKKYNIMSLVQESTDRLGLTTKFTYDALNRPLTATDPHGNIVGHKYENGGLRVTEAINGDLRKVTELDAFARPTRETSYPDSGDKSTAICLLHEASYNGNGKVIKKTLSQKSTAASGTSPSNLLETETTRYGPTQTVQSETLVGYKESGKDTVSRQYVLDLFDNNITYTKQTSYADGRTFTHQGPIRIYDANNHLAIHRHQEGKEERYHYNENGWHQKTLRFDGTETSYTYDDAGRTIRVAYPSSTTENTFDADGKLTETREGADVVTYKFSLDGIPTGVVYSDGRSQSIGLDKFSRTIKETDVFGVAKETEYNGVGLVTRRSCQGDIITHSYGTANHTHGQHLGYAFSGSSVYQSNIAYDGFDRLRQNTIKDSASTTLLETTYQLDARGKVQSLKSASATFAELNNARNFSYDGIGQVVQETHIATGTSVTKYAYDGNSNVVSVATDGHMTSIRYNKIDQRIDEGFKYDENGRLLQDNEGLKYAFDERDRLLSVSASSDKPTKFTYRADDRLAEKHEGDADSATFYHNTSTSQVDAVHTTKKEAKAQDAKTSLLSDADSIVAGYTNGQCEGHFLHELGSTAVVMGQGGSHVSARYGAYGIPKATTLSPGNVLSAFGFAQALTDQKSGLIYLDARFYSPKQMAFLCMDTYNTENRYAYCAGDPVNRIDPSGHGWVDWLATGLAIGVSIGVAAAVTALTGGTAFPLAMAVIGGALGGALGNVTSLAVTGIGGEHHSWSDYAWAAGSGAAIGGLSAGMGHSAKFLAQENVVKAIWTGAAVSGTIGGLNEGVTMLRKGEDFDFSRVLMGAAKGAAIGVFTGYWGRRDYIRNFRVNSVEGSMISSQVSSRAGSFIERNGSLVL